jgi:hypothetical protein
MWLSSVSVSSYVAPLTFQSREKETEENNFSPGIWMEGERVFINPNLVSKLVINVIHFHRNLIHIHFYPFSFTKQTHANNINTLFSTS